MTASDFYISPAIDIDREALLSLHMNVRHRTDLAIVPEYAEATQKSGYYEKLWRERFPEKGVAVLKAETEDGQLIGFCAFGRPYMIEYPEEYPDDKLGIYKEGLAELH